MKIFNLRYALRRISVKISSYVPQDFFLNSFLIFWLRSSNENKPLRKIYELARNLTIL